MTRQFDYACPNIAVMHVDGLTFPVIPILPGVMRNGQVALDQGPLCGAGQSIIGIPRMGIVSKSFPVAAS
jgi:hypothetical protein